MMARIAQMRALRASGISFQNNAHYDLANHSSGSSRGERVARPSPLRPNVANLVGQTKMEKFSMKLRSGLGGKARDGQLQLGIKKNGKVTIQGNIRLGVKRIRRKCPKGTLFVRGDRLFKPVSQGGFKPGPFNRSFRLPGPDRSGPLYGPVWGGWDL
ncbi:hypothetical protein QJS10_CPA10g00073 [Acorus calamus]|uniref:Uncharacterized protein n=1 Tax=Acorus calamus TaxID=4465 RepID=A0AAV9E0C5_ACOCL|nr:hypothetical protein QJS10_CPA10g00073 [Acorus calamus]